MDLKKRFWLSAGYTVEASVAVPLLLGLVWFCILSAFLLHDRVVLEAQVIGASYGMECSEESLFLLEEAVLEKKEGLWSTVWTGTADYPGLSVPLLKLVYRTRSVKAEWKSGTMSLPAVLRLQQLYHSVVQED